MASQNVWLRNFPEKQKADRSDDDLLVFGYSCKLFRDDERAMYIDQGKHLIPWMGDESLKIDRYDVRGYLHDLQKHEAKPEFWDVEYASEDARQVEQLCQTERYFALYTDVTEEDFYHEEELKRLKAALAEDGAYHEIGFSYENSEEPEEEPIEEADEPDDPEDRPFTLPPGFTVPEGMVLPETMKLHIIIEKTAVFISQHGAQMEIVVKTKQSSNSQFAFLSFDSPLNPYYKYLVSCIKLGKYQPQPLREEMGSDEDDDDDHYLHPSLLGNKNDLTPVNVPDLEVFRGHQDNAYSLLVRNLKEKVIGSGSNSPSSRIGHSYGADDLLQPPPLPPFMDNYWSQYLLGTPPPPGLEPVTLPPHSEQPPPPGDEFLYGYVPGSEPTFHAVPPPPDVQPIIDKMAEYVARSGEDFEMVVKSKSDKRFEFLRSEHEYHQYYLYKKRLHIHKKQKELQEKEQLKKKVQEKLNALAKSAPIMPVSFSIKAKETDGKEKKRNFLVDETDSEGEEGKARRAESGEAQPAAPAPFTLPPQTEEKLKKFKMEIEAKLAEERLKDRLAAAAREKLSQHSKERQLQLERKRKAALFLNMLKNSPSGAAIAKAASEQKKADQSGVPFGPQPLESGSTGSPISSRLGLDDSLKENGNSTSKLRSNSEIKSRVGYETHRQSRSSRPFHRSKSRSVSPRKSRSPDYKKSRTRHDHTRHRTTKSDHTKDKRQKTPPAAYSLSRRSRSRSSSPRWHRQRSRSRSRDRTWRR